MASARPGVHVVSLRPVQVSENLITGRTFIKLNEETANGGIVTLKVDPKGYLLYWRDQNKECDYIEISLIRDARSGKQARIPKDLRFRELVTSLDGSSSSSADCPIEDRILTVVYGTDMVNLSFVSFVADSKQTSKEWAAEIFLYATNMLALNNCPLQFLDKGFSKLSLCGDGDGTTPIRNVVKMFVQNKDDKKRVEQALSSALQLPSGKNDRLSCRFTSFQNFFNFYRNLSGRQEIDRVFREVGGRKGHLTAEQFVDFLNDEQRDPRLNEILYPPSDVKRALALIDQFESSRDLAAKGHLSQDGFLCYLLSEENAVLPQEKFDLCDDMSQPLSHYFVNSSHNTYLTGNQWTGKSSVEIYRQVLLSGCRCVELDC